MISRSTTLRERAFVIGTDIHGAGIGAVLVGGSAATFYAPEAYQSTDIGFVLTYWDESTLAARALRESGFEGPVPTFWHPDTSLSEGEGELPKYREFEARLAQERQR